MVREKEGGFHKATRHARPGNALHTHSLVVQVVFSVDVFTLKQNSKAREYYMPGVPA